MDSHEELKDLEPLPLHELIVRLTLLYKHIKAHPYKDTIASGDLLGEVATHQVDELCKYLYLADQSYDCGTEANLRDALGELGKHLPYTISAKTFPHFRLFARACSESYTKGSLKQDTVQPHKLIFLLWVFSAPN